MDRIVEYYFNAKVIAGAFPQVLAGFRTTVIVSLLIIVCGTLPGLSPALLRCPYNPTPLMAAAVIFFVILYPFARWVARLERQALKAR